MYLVDRKGLMLMPPGTLYSEWKPCISGGMSIKMETITHSLENIDWQMQPLQDWYTDQGQGEGVADEYFERGRRSPELDCTTRDGMFDPDQKYLIWEQEDHQALIDLLIKSYQAAYC